MTEAAFLFPLLIGVVLGWVVAVMALSWRVLKAEKRARDLQDSLDAAWANNSEATRHFRAELAKAQRNDRRGPDGRFVKADRELGDLVAYGADYGVRVHEVRSMGPVTAVYWQQDDEASKRAK